MRNPRLITDDHYQGLPLHQDHSRSTAYRADMLERIQALLNEACQSHSKVLFIRFDVHFPADRQAPEDNQLIVGFLNRLCQDLNRRKLDPRYFYCRENGPSSGRPHYHVFLLLDGHKIQTIKGVLAEVERLWGIALKVDARGLVDFCNGSSEGQRYNGIQLRRNDPEFGNTLDYVFKWCGYCAKVSSKEDLGHNVRSFGSSRVRSAQSNQPSTRNQGK